MPFTGERFWANVIGQKILTVLFLLGTTALAMAITGRLRPGRAAAAGVLVGWNPLLQWETAGNAHNDIVMIFFMLAAVYAVLRGWWRAVFPLLGLAIATKYTLVLLGPVLLVWMLRRRDIPRREIAISLALGVALTFALYAPFLAGGEMLDGLRRESGHITASTGSGLAAWFWSRLQMPPDQADRTMKFLLTPLFLAGYAALLWRIPRAGSVSALVRTSAWVVFLFLVIAKWWFWPWYLLWLVPLAALLPGSRPALAASVFSLTVMMGIVTYQ